MSGDQSDPASFGPGPPASGPVLPPATVDPYATRPEPPREVRRASMVLYAIVGLSVLNFIVSPFLERLVIGVVLGIAFLFLAWQRPSNEFFAAAGRLR